MADLAPDIDTGDLVHEVGIVGPHDERSWSVRARSGVYVAKRATSCLVSPQPGDQVALARTASTAYILAVLERSAEGPTPLSADGDVEWRVEGTFGVSAREGIELGTPKEIGVVGESVRLHAARAEAAIGESTFVGKVLVSHIERVKQVATRLDQFADRITQTADRYLRAVKREDLVRAETLDHKASQTMALHARNGAITADRLLKVDADQIHLG